MGFWLEGMALLFVEVRKKRGCGREKSTDTQGDGKVGCLLVLKLRKEGWTREMNVQIDGL